MPTDAARFTNIARLVHLNQSRSGNGDLGNILSAGKAGRVIDKSGNGETIKDEVIEWEVCLESDDTILENSVLDLLDNRSTLSINQDQSGTRRWHWLVGLD